MVRKNVVLRYMLILSLLFSFCLVGFGGSSAKAAATQGITQKIRFIRNYINGNTVEPNSHWVEIQAYAGGRNVALNKPVTGSTPSSAANLAKVDDGDIGNLAAGVCPNYAGLGSGLQWVQIDLGQLYQVDYVRLWHYYEDFRKYHDNITQVSANGNTWVTLYDSNVDGEIYEKLLGQTLQIANPYASASGSKGIPVRYVRDNVYGSDVNAKDAWMEIAAYSPDGTDVALHKPVTGDFTPMTGDPNGWDRGFDVVTDGDYTVGVDTCAASGAHFVQIDLGGIYNIDRLQIWRCFDDRSFNYRKFNSDTQVSTDGEHWLSVYNTDLSGTYLETDAGHLIGLDISVSHPSNVSFKIDPNKSTPFADGEIPLKNNSDMPVKVYLQSLSEASGGNLKLNNVLPSAYSDWSKLTKSQTTSEAAFGIRIKEKSPSSRAWQSINQAGTVYTANMGKTLMGTLNAKGIGTLVLDGNCGLAWDKQYTIANKFSLIFSS